MRSPIDSNVTILQYQYLEYSLTEYLDKPQSERKLSNLQVILQMLESLMHIHNRGCSHLDVKPDNFRVHQDCVKIIDFGIVEEYMYTNKEGTFHCANSNVYGAFKGSEHFASSRTL